MFNLFGVTNKVDNNVYLPNNTKQKSVNYRKLAIVDRFA